MVVLDRGVTGCLCKLLIQKKLLVIWSDGVDCYVSNTEGVVEILEKRCSTISVESWASGRNFFLPLLKERGRIGVMVFCGSARTRTPRGYGEFESDSIIQSSWNLIHSAKHEPSYKIDRQHSSIGQQYTRSIGQAQALALQFNTRRYAPIGNHVVNSWLCEPFLWFLETYKYLYPYTTSVS